MSFTSVTSRWTSTAEEIQTTTSVNDNLPLFEIHTNGSLLTPMKASFLECVEEEDFSLTAGLGTPFRSQNGLYTPNSMASPTPNEGGLNTYNANTFTTAAGNIENVGHHFVIAMDNTTRGSAMNDGEKMDLEVVRPRGLYDDDNDKKDERHCFCEGCSIM